MAMEESAQPAGEYIERSGGLCGVVESADPGSEEPPESEVDWYMLFSLLRPSACPLDVTVVAVEVI